MHALRTLAVAALCLPLLRPEKPQQPPAASRPLVQWIGADSARTQPGFVLVRDQDAWLALWAAHTGKDTTPGGAMGRHTAPEINFDRCIVVAFFRGRTTNADGEVANTIDDFPDHVRVRFTPDTFQTASFDGPDRGIATTPYGIWVIPSTPKAVVIEEGGHGLKHEEKTWRHVHRFEAP